MNKFMSKYTQAKMNRNIARKNNTRNSTDTNIMYDIFDTSHKNIHRRELIIAIINTYKKIMIQRENIKKQKKGKERKNTKEGDAI